MLKSVRKAKSELDSELIQTPLLNFQDGVSHFPHIHLIRRLTLKIAIETKKGKDVLL